MSIIAWMIFGGLVGWVASLIMRTDAEQGMAMNIIVGVIGAVLGGWLASLVGYGGVSGFNIYSFMVALVGSVALIALVQAINRTAWR